MRFPEGVGDFLIVYDIFILNLLIVVMLVSGGTERECGL